MRHTTPEQRVIQAHLSGHVDQFPAEDMEKFIWTRSAEIVYIQPDRNAIKVGIEINYSIYL